MDNLGGIQPWLAESYKVGDDLKSITFNLRKGVKFHDGSDFNAQVVKWNLDNIIAKKLQPNWDSVTIIDDYTVKVNLKQWQNTLLRAFDMGAAMISKASFDKNGIDWARYNPVGTGPFKFVSFQRDTSFKTVRNPDYWQKVKPYLDAVEYLFIADKMTQQAAIQAGEADALMVEPGKTAADMERLGLQIKASLIATHVLQPDTANADSPWANKKVREAIEYAIDRESIAKSFGYGYLHAPYQIPGPATAIYDPNFALGRKFDQAKAKQLLTEAGYPNGFKTTIIVSPISLIREIPEAVQAYLGQIGITVELEFPTAAKFSEYTNGTWRNGALYEPVAGGGNFNSSLGQWTPDRAVRNSWLRTPEFKQAYYASITAPTMDIKLIRAASDMLIQDASIIPVNESGKGWAIKSYVMDSGFLERYMPPFLKSEQAWLNK